MDTRTVLWFFVSQDRLRVGISKRHREGPVKQKERYIIGSSTTPLARLKTSDAGEGKETLGLNPGSVVRSNDRLT